MRFITLGGEVKEEVYYTVEMCKIKGTIKGEEVTGFGGIDQVWQTPGVTWHQGKIYLFIEDIWVPFFNEYKDSTFEYGHFLKGREGWSVGYFVKNGKAYMNNDFSMDVNWSPETGRPRSIDIEIGPHKFKWTPDIEMQEPEETRPHISYSEGTMRNLAEKTELIRHQSWIEYRPKHMWGQAAKNI